MIIVAFGVARACGHENSNRSRAYYFIGVLRNAFMSVIIINANDGNSGRHLEEWPLLRAAREPVSLSVRARW